MEGDPHCEGRERRDSAVYWGYKQRPREEEEADRREEFSGRTRSITLLIRESGGVGRQVAEQGCEERKERRKGGGRRVKNQTHNPSLITGMVPN